jgi:anti-anti-sigma factor
MAEDLLATSLYRDGSKRTLVVTGELDVATAPLFEDALNGALDGQGGEFCLDLSGLTFMDSTGARAIVRANNAAELLSSRLVILSPTPIVRRVFGLMGLDQVVDIEEGAPARSA